jgi:hypothetical protein
MRPMIEPPPSLHCTVCRGELRLKRVDLCKPASEFDTEILICIKCGHEHEYRVSHDPYVMHQGSPRPPS